MSSKKNEKKPERCFSCKNCHYNHDLQYYPYCECLKNGKEIHFSDKNGWEKMVWCPLDEEKQ